MQLFAFGVNHHTAPVAVREQVSFGGESLPGALVDLTRHHAAEEAAIVSTCNRTEIYCKTDDPGRTLHWLAEYHSLKAAAIEPYIYTLPREKAVQHAFRVASGLDSMVLGEPQILGQMKEAVRSAEEAGTLGFLLNKLFQKAFSVAKEVRSQTAIGASSVSMAAAAVRLAEQIFPSIGEQAVLFIGAGEMIELCATHFCARAPRQVTVANRTPDRAALLARQFGASVATLTEVPELIARHDIVISCTASPLPIIGKGLVERAVKIRRHQPLFIVDLAVPRDVEAEVAELDDVFLYTVDDLGEVVQSGFDNRQAAVSQAESIIDSRVQAFVHWMESRELVPTIRNLRDHAERQRRHELERAMKLLARGEPAEKVLDALSKGLTNKFLHGPSHALNHAPAEERDEVARTLARIFNLHSPE